MSPQHLYSHQQKLPLLGLNISLSHSRFRIVKSTSFQHKTITIFFFLIFLSIHVSIHPSSTAHPFIHHLSIHSSMGLPIHPYLLHFYFFMHFFILLWNVKVRKTWFLPSRNSPVRHSGWHTHKHRNIHLLMHLEGRHSARIACQGLL